ncbi:hypothetical protein GIS00_14160 [Nakamurella sp. YIM 132087]|uniref:Uncharacterized protein n=1 Tax=Nakamurella alba TaxID=2665158 RepID=A0A7K1FPD9_9ACTN|nr:hypothetical protein [Nakamurella alba]MTD15083.1 hypothetical protein [Nakamurella alba]
MFSHSVLDEPANIAGGSSVDAVLSPFQYVAPTGRSVELQPDGEAPDWTEPGEYRGPSRGGGGRGNGRARTNRRGR